MALNTINAIREAERQAQNVIKRAQEEAELRISEASEKAVSLASKAYDSVKIRIESSVDKAHKVSEEIIVSATNSAILEAENLRKECLQKQALVNKRISELLI